MRNYQVMRNILVQTLLSKDELQMEDFLGLNFNEKIENVYKEELSRLEEEGLIIHDIRWGESYLIGGTIKGLTAEGKKFARCIRDDSVWLGVYETLKRSQLDISYPLIEKVCERIAEKIVMSYIPEDFK